MTDEVLKGISQKLDHLLALVATNTVRGLKTNEAILVLGAAGLDRNLIAQIVRTTPGTVSVRLSEAKARKTPIAKEEKTAKAKD